MKKIGVLLAVLLAGCGAQPQPADYAAQIKEVLGGDYAFTAEFCYEKIEGKAQVKKQGEDGLTLTVSEPATMAGLVLELAGEEMTLTYAGMEIDLAESVLPAESVTELLRQALSGTDDYTIEVQEDAVLATGGSLLIHYTITFEKSGMAPQSIAVPELGFTAKISDFKHTGAL